MSSLTLAIDAMGGDRGPAIVIAALNRALQSFPETHFLVFGDSRVLHPLFKAEKIQNHPRVTLEHTDEIIEMDDKPGQSLRGKPKASMRLAIEAVAEGRAQACVSCGNTGALMAIAYVRLKTIPGVIRPALVAQIPTEKGCPGYLLDLGANPRCDADTLFQFGVMGSVLSKEVAGIAQPKVALLNMGVEDIKGTDAVRQAGQQLAQCNDINYIGFIEGNDLFSGKADVVVCDGFTGNIALKSCEGMAQLVYKKLSSSLKGHWFSRFIAWFLLKRFKKAWQWLNPDQYDGASLLGLRGVVMKSHGNASATAFYHAIKQAQAESSLQVPERIHDRVESVLLKSQ